MRPNPPMLWELETVMDGERKKERLRKNVKTVIRSTLIKEDLSLEETKNLAQNGKDWKKQYFRC